VQCRFSSCAALGFGCERTDFGRKSLADIGMMFPMPAPGQAAGSGSAVDITFPARSRSILKNKAGTNRKIFFRFQAGISFVFEKYAFQAGLLFPSAPKSWFQSGLSFVYRSSYPSNAVAAAAAADLPAMAPQMPPVSFDRRDRADALPTGSTESNAAGALTAGEQALVEQIRQHGGKAEVICIVRPHGAPQDSSEVYVLQGSSRAFVDQLSQTHGGRGLPAPMPAGEAPRAAAIPPAAPLR
jgi:hypothetical protein